MSRLVTVLRSARHLRSRTGVPTDQSRAVNHKAQKLLNHAVRCSGSGSPHVSLCRAKSTSVEAAGEEGQRDYLFETFACSHGRQAHPEAPQPGKKAKLVIFDKDGTLICFQSMWSSWAVRVTEGIARQLGNDALQEKLYQTFGVCPRTKRVFPGLLAEQTTEVIQDSLVEMLVSEGIDKDAARAAVDSSWQEGDQGKNADAVQSIHPDLLDLFNILKAKGIKIAICTADNRSGTLNTLRHMGLDRLVDTLVCGDDPDTQPKPSPHNALKICRELGVEPTETVMVGDTKADVGMGHSAGLGWNVGVLSGVGDTQELLPKAHAVIDNVKDLLPLIMPYEDWVNFYGYSSHERVLVAPAAPAVEAPPAGARQAALGPEGWGLVILDLHGTLVDGQHKVAWVDRLTQRLEAKTGLSLASPLESELGLKNERVGEGLLADGRPAQLKEALVQLLREHGFHFEEAVITVNQAWADCECAELMARAPLDSQTAGLLQQLREAGVKIAVNTTEARQVAVQELKAAGLLAYVDMMVCGDDPGSQGKPSPHNPLLICDELGVASGSTIVIGDTTEDVRMGLNAEVGLTLGVLTGVGGKADLAEADAILPSVSHVLAHLSSTAGPAPTPAATPKSPKMMAGRYFSTKRKQTVHLKHDKATSAPPGARSYSTGISPKWRASVTSRPWRPVEPLQDSAEQVSSSSQLD